MILGKGERLSGFVSLPAPVTAEAPTPEQTTLEGGGFWPDIDLQRFRDEMRADDSITLARVRGAVVAAFVHVANDLLPSRVELQLAGHASLAAAGGDQVGDETVRVAMFRRAVFCFAKAELVEAYRDWDITRKGEDRAELLELTADDHRRNGRNALSDFRGAPRTVVELI